MSRVSRRRLVFVQAPLYAPWFVPNLLVLLREEKSVKARRGGHISRYEAGNTALRASIIVLDKARIARCECMSRCSRYSYTYTAVRDLSWNLEILISDRVMSDYFTQGW